jgi:hypothetical protein
VNDPLPQLLNALELQLLVAILWDDVRQHLLSGASPLEVGVDCFHHVEVRQLDHLVLPLLPQSLLSLVLLDIVQSRLDCILPVDLRIVLNISGVGWSELEVLVVIDALGVPREELSHVLNVLVHLLIQTQLDRGYSH